MNNPRHIYELLLDYAACAKQAAAVCIGPVWTVCQTDEASGLAMSPHSPCRTLPWPGTLVGKTLGELSAWLTDWEPYKATVGMAAVTASLNQYPLPAGVTLLPSDGNTNLSVFDYFLPRLVGKKVVVIGRYPGIEQYADRLDLSIIERQPQAGDYPDPASEFLLPTADWVFLTASSITNKTFPRLAELSQNATTVLMGPTVPWLPQLHEFGIDYLAGVEVLDAKALYQTAAEGGGVRIFDRSVRYRVVELSPETSMAWLKTRIADEFTGKQDMTEAMERWYAAGNSKRFPDYDCLAQTTTRLSRMDSSYKRLWDEHH